MGVRWLHFLWQPSYLHTYTPAWEEKFVGVGEQRNSLNKQLNKVKLNKLTKLNKEERSAHGKTLKTQLVGKWTLKCGKCIKALREC